MDYQQSLYKHLRDNRAISSQPSFVRSKSSQTDLIPFPARLPGLQGAVAPVLGSGAPQRDGSGDLGSCRGPEQGERWEAPCTARVDAVFAQPAPKNNKQRKPASVGARCARLTPAAATPG